MIKKLQRRFIRIALVALTAAMVLVAAIVNTANWISVRNELNETISLLEDNGGSPGLRDGKEKRAEGKNRHTRNMVNESRWFSVSFDGEGSRKSINLMNAAETGEDEAAELAQQALQSGKDSGFVQDYMFRVQEAPRGTTVLMLNCETKLTAVRNLAVISLLACAGCILLALLFVALASRRAIEPTVRNMEQQKQFITNASHELKTPLTVIATNMELLQMELPDNPWVKSTQKQTGQMRHLVDELVYLSRMEEENAPMEAETLALDALLRETAEPFIDMAEYQGKTFDLDAESGLEIRGDRASIQRLASTLLDNAVKYASDGGTIRAEARSEGRHAVLAVSNDVAEPLTAEQCRQLFDRFYRADSSRNKEKQGGFGIGLAIAAAITEKHGGSISAAMDGNRLVFTCRLPKGGH